MNPSKCFVCNGTGIVASRRCWYCLGAKITWWPTGGVLPSRVVDLYTPMDDFAMYGVYGVGFG